MSIDEAELEAAMRAGRRGDAAAYASALHAIARRVRARIGRRLGVAAADAEDVVQEVLLTVHLKRATWDEARPLMPWVNAIADHKTADARRRRARQVRFVAPTVTADDVAELVPAEAVEPERAGVDLERCLAALPSRERQVVRLLTVDGHSVREVAGELGIAEGAVRVALHRGLKRLALAARRAAT